MAFNNFKNTTGGNYISKGGNSSLPGTVDATKRTLSDLAASAINIIGAGIYVGTIPDLNITGQLIGDGKVIIDGNSVAGSFGSRWQRIENVEVRNALWGGTTESGVAKQGLFKGIGRAITGTYLATSSIARRLRATDWIWINCSFGSGALGAPEYLRCIIINSTLISLYGLKDSYVDPVSIVQAEPTVSTLNIFQGLFRNNNIQGIISLPVTGGLYKQYAIQDQFIGTPQANGYAVGVNWLTEAQLTTDGYTGTVAGWNAAVATCMNRAPNFNDVNAEDFTLQANSPHIRTASDGVSNIGGTPIAISIINTDDGNAAGTLVKPNASIDTTVALSYVLLSGQTEGYVDYVVKINGATINKLSLKDAFNFDSDYVGGTTQNNNVDDAQPLTTDYPDITTTNGTGGTTSEIKVPAGLIAALAYVRVNGQHRQVLSKTTAGGTDTLALSSALLAIVGPGVGVSYGTEAELASLNPNRLTVLMRTRSASGAPSYPFVGSDWDNEVSGSYGVAGVLFQQEVDQKPGLIISGGIIYGSGDSTAPTGITPQDLAPQWVHIRVYKRNNYASTGI